MTIKSDIINELIIEDGVKPNSLALLMNMSAKKMSGHISILKKEGCIEQVEGMVYLTEKGRNFTADSMPQKNIPPAQKESSKTAHSVPDNPSSPKIPPQTDNVDELRALWEQLECVRQQLKPKAIDNIGIKLAVLEQLAEMLSDDIGQVLQGVISDYNLLNKAS